MTETLYNSIGAAEYAGVSPVTIQNHIKRGYLATLRIVGRAGKKRSGHVIARSELLRWVRWYQGQFKYEQA